MKIPKKYEERFGSLVQEPDLIDDCKYMLYFADGWEYADYNSVPVKSKKEALEFLKMAYKKKIKNKK